MLQRQVGGHETNVFSRDSPRRAESATLGIDGRSMRGRLGKKARSRQLAECCLRDQKFARRGAKTLFKML